MRGKLLILVILLAVPVLTSCSPKATPLSDVSKEPVATLSILPQAVPSQPWEQRWENVVKAAKKEGFLLIYATALTGSLRESLISSFTSRFGVRVEVVSGMAGAIAQKILSEKMAGIYLTDLSMSGTSTPITVLKPQGVLDSMEPLLLLPEVLDPRVWYGERFPWADDAHTTVRLLGAIKKPIVINTNLVNPGEIKSFVDLLNPKWKGKIISGDPTAPGGTARLFGMIGEYIMGWDYLRELKKQELFMGRVSRGQDLQWLALGKFPIALGTESETLAEYKTTGAPIAAITPAEGTYIATGGSSIAVMKRAPHPNATMLFINWLLSKEGLTVFSKAAGLQTTRNDVPTDFIPLDETRQPGVKYFTSDDEEYLMRGPERHRILLEIFGKK